MPFGLRNTPTTFQRLMKLVLGDFKIYLHVVIVYLSTWPAHVKSFGEIFDGLRAVFLTLFLDKCKFGKWILPYLGKKVWSICLTKNSEQSWTSRSSEPSWAMPFPGNAFCRNLSTWWPHWPGWPKHFHLCGQTRVLLKLLKLSAVLCLPVGQEPTPYVVVVLVTLGFQYWHVIRKGWVWLCLV